MIPGPVMQAGLKKSGMSFDPVGTGRMFLSLTPSAPSRHGEGSGNGNNSAGPFFGADSACLFGERTRVSSRFASATQPTRAFGDRSPGPRWIGFIVFPANAIGVRTTGHDVLVHSRRSDAKASPVSPCRHGDGEVSNVGPSGPVEIATRIEVHREQSPLPTRRQFRRHRRPPGRAGRARCPDGRDRLHQW